MVIVDLPLFLFGLVSRLLLAIGRLLSLVSGVVLGFLVGILVLILLFCVVVRRGLRLMVGLRMLGGLVFMVRWLRRSI